MAHESLGKTAFVSGLTLATACVAPGFGGAERVGPEGKQEDATRTSPGEAHGVFACALGGNPSHHEAAWDKPNRAPYVVYTVHDHSNASLFWVVTRPPLATPAGRSQLFERPLVLHGWGARSNVDYPHPGRHALAVFRPNGDIEFAQTNAHDNARPVLIQGFDRAARRFLGRWFAYWNAWTDEDHRTKEDWVQDGDDRFVAIRDVLWTKTPELVERKRDVFTQVASMTEEQAVALLDAEQRPPEPSTPVMLASLPSEGSPVLPDSAPPPNIDIKEAYCDVGERYESLLQAMQLLEILADARDLWVPGTDGLDDGLSQNTATVQQAMDLHLSFLRGADWSDPDVLINALSDHGCPASRRLAMRRCPNRLHEWFAHNAGFLKLDL